MIKKSLYDWCIENNRKDLLEEWDIEKNEGITPKDIGYGSRINIHWVCNKGHKWEKCANSRIRHGCPYCSNMKALEGYNDLTTTNPELIKEWHPTKNGNLRPTDVVKCTKKKVWWICDKGHEWDMSVQSRTLGKQGCPYCANKRILEGYNDLTTTNPELAKEWHPTKNGSLKPTDVSSGSRKKVWWICTKKHEWIATVDSRDNGNGCPVCANKVIIEGFNDLMSSHPNIAKEWNYELNKDLLPTHVSAGSNKKVWWKCEKGHIWKSDIKNRTSGTKCPECSKNYNSSFPEKAVYFYIKKIFDDAIPNYRPNWLEGKELDIYIPSLDLAIEYDGEYFHKRNSRSEKNDLIKNNLIKRNKKYLIRIKEFSSRYSKVHYEDEDYIKYVYTESRPLSHLDRCINQTLEIILSLKEFDECIVNKIKNIKINTELDRVNIYELMKLIKIDNSLINTHSDIIKEWHPTKNGDLKPEHFNSKSRDVLWWICDRGHSYEMSIKSKVNECNCPYCINKKVLQGYNDLKSQRPDVAKYWDYNKNELLPEEVIYCSNKKAYFKCNCGNEWHGQIRNKNICAKCNK